MFSQTGSEEKRREAAQVSRETSGCSECGKVSKVLNLFDLGKKNIFNIIGYILSKLRYSILTVKLRMMVSSRPLDPDQYGFVGCDAVTDIRAE